MTDIDRVPGVVRAIKTVIEWTAAAILCLLALPAFVVIALAIILDDGWPVFFVQERVGRAGTTFRMLKFRSMRVNDISVEELGQVRRDHPLVTKVGRVLRRTHADELPQLFNVLRLQMALVGPRPTVIEQVRKYDVIQRRRLDVRPGLTGWAQVNGSVELSWDERIMLDVWYIAHWSLRLDVIILFRTAAVVLFGEHRDEKALSEARTYTLSIARSS